MIYNIIYYGPRKGGLKSIIQTTQKEIMKKKKTTKTFFVEIKDNVLKNIYIQTLKY